MTVYFNDMAQMEKILGINDCNLAYLEFLYGGELHSRGNRLSGSLESTRFPSFIERLGKLAASHEEAFSEGELYMEWQALAGEGKEDSREDSPSISVAGRTLWPKSRTQRLYLDALANAQLVFATGPAGTGKTFLAIGYALGEVLSGRKQKLVLTRPVVEAGESLGFLPGDL